VRTYGLSDDQQDLVWSSLRAGESVRSIARHHQVPLQHVQRYFRQTGGVRPTPRSRSTRHLSAAEREEISRGIAAAQSARVIAARLGRAPATVSREIARNGGRAAYRAQAADSAALQRARRPKVSLLAARPVLRARVEAGLALEWSPQQISRRLVLDFPDDQLMRVSHETIYLSIFQPTRKALSPRLHRHLRTGRLMRLPAVARQPSGRGRIKDMVPIRRRPPHIEDRRVGGHWEGDLVMGRRPSAVATLVERRTRYLRLVALPKGLKAVPVRRALVADLNQVPHWQRRSLTWDRGREMADHARLTRDTGCLVYFRDPSSPWQRGTNENTNRLLRQYLPKSGDLGSYDQAALDAIADRLNNRPRAVLGWQTPAEAFAALHWDDGWNVP
jgi:IS30 family transposase